MEFMNRYYVLDILNIIVCMGFILAYLRKSKESKTAEYYFRFFINGTTWGMIGVCWFLKDPVRLFPIFSAVLVALSSQCVSRLYEMAKKADDIKL